MIKFLFSFLLISFLFCSLFSHPIPDIPVSGNFEDNNSASITVTLDTRVFADDPEQVPFLTLSQFNLLSLSQKNELLTQAKETTENSLLVRINQKDWFLPEFIYKFENKSAEQLSAEEAIVLIRGDAILPPWSSINSFQIRSREESPYDLVFTNKVNGKPLKRVNVLWPGEESFILNLAEFILNPSPEQQSSATFSLSSEPKLMEEKESEDSQGTFFSFLRQGFVHVVPLGLDHILFVLGIYLLSRKWKPILLQVSVFTIAHTITLGLATLGVVSVPSNMVEPIIAASIAVVAIENIFFPGFRPHRLLVVFVFGLIHGLGFAGALSAFNLDSSSLLLGLLGFNIGVELGQLAVISIATLLTLKFSEKDYRKWVVVPGSIVISIFGIYWTIERLF